MADHVRESLRTFAEAGLPRLLFVTHAWGGGVEQHVAELAALVSHGARVMVLRPFDESSVEIECPERERFRLACDDWPLLLDSLKAMRFDRVHLHHVHGLPQRILDIDLALEIPLDCTLHDYSSVCPQYQLVDPSGRYCGEPDEAGCNQCIMGRPHAWRLSISEWRQAFARVLTRADRVLAPSMSVVKKIKRYFPAVDLIFFPHSEHTAPPPHVVKVALLGSLSNAKGLSVALSVAAHAAAARSALLVRLIGHAAEPLPPTLAATGSYKASDLPRLIAGERPDVVWLPSQVPETFSYTLSVALASGLPIVASNIGALADRLRDVPQATLIAYDATTEQWHSALLAASTRSPYFLAPANASDESLLLIAKNTNDAYASRYLKGLPSAVTAGSATLMAALRSNKRSLQTLQTIADRPLLSVFRIGVHAGHRPSTEVVERALEALAPGETDVVGRTQYQVVEEELNRVQQLVADHQDLLVVKHEQYADAMATLQLSLETEHAQSFASLQTQYADAMDATQAAHSEESQRWRAILDDADERARAARDHIAHLEALVEQQQIRHAALDADRIEMLSSTSWLLTRPLRAMMRRARGAKHLANSTVHLLPRLPSLMRGGVARFRRGGWRSVQDRLAIEFQPPAISAAMKLPENVPVAIASLTLHTDVRDPLLSILIPVYGQHETTFACLKSISESQLLRRFEVIVMDDCSPEPAQSTLAQVNGIRILRNETNLGFIGNVNAAATHARGQWLIILNNDTIVRPGALDALLNTFDDHQNVGLVGAKLLNADGSVQEAGGIVWRDGSAWNWGRGQHRDDPRFNFVRDADFCSGAALAISRQLFGEMGGFDSHYAPAYYEDADLAFRIRARGLRVLYQPSAEIFHIEGVSHGRDESAGVKSYQAINAKKFFERWQQTLFAHRENATEPDLEAHRASRSNILVVEACMITPDQDAGSVRMMNMLRILRDEGHHVTFVADNLDGNPKYAAILTSMGIEVLHGQYAGSVRKVLRDRGNTLNAIIFCRYYIAIQYVNSVRSLAPRAQIIFDTVDLHFIREEREAQLLGNAAMVRSAALTRAKELSVVEKSDVTIVVSDVEKTLLAKIKSSARVDIVSLINAPINVDAPFAERSGIIFIGGFRHAPNVDAIKWYASEVFPILKRLLPDVVTTIVGSNMPDEVSALRQNGLRILGFVENTDPLLRAARVSVAPLRYGAGIKGKINEAMNYGIPVVATECAVEGMQLTDQQDVLVADDAYDFAQAIVRLHTDSALWDRLSSAGRANVHAHFSPDAARPAIRALLIR
jgi:O-antigen biosynthesis protein